MSPHTHVCPLGAWEKDKRQGTGKYTYANGDVYEGEWAENLRDGQGSYLHVLTGSKVRVCLHSGWWGEMRPLGKWCVCVLFQLTPHPPCIYAQYEGSWVKGVRQGAGQIVHPHHTFAGNFLDDQVCL